MKHTICDECETVEHCSNNGCIPKQPAQQQGCTRSHPHENMGAMCKLRTEIARLTNENARLKAAQQQEPMAWAQRTKELLEVFNVDHPEVSGCGGLQQPASKSWVELTDEEIGAACGFAEHFIAASTRFALKAISRAIEAKLREKNA